MLQKTFEQKLCTFVSLFLRLYASSLIFFAAGTIPYHQPNVVFFLVKKKEVSQLNKPITKR